MSKARAVCGCASLFSERVSQSGQAFYSMWSFFFNLFSKCSLNKTQLVWKCYIKSLVSLSFLCCSISILTITGTPRRQSWERLYHQVASIFLHKRRKSHWLLLVTRITNHLWFHWSHHLWSHRWSDFTCLIIHFAGTFWVALLRFMIFSAPLSSALHSPSSNNVHHPQQGLEYRNIQNIIKKRQQM